MNAKTKVAGMDIEEFSRLYDQEGPFELVEGERIVMSPPKFKHSKYTHRVFTALLPFIETHKLGEAFIETAFVNTPSDNPNWVTGSRVPDLMFIRAERLQVYEQSLTGEEDRPLALIPDFIVEVISSNDLYSDVDQKVEDYLRDGVQLIWVVNPRSKKVTVYQAGTEQPKVFTLNQTLSGDPVIPGFELPVAVIFA